ncbi:MAG: SRPBCC domain-containing protein [Microbacterium gubbeenense]
MVRTDRAAVLVHVDPARVFAALTSREALVTWLPPAGMLGRLERFDMREGGSYRLVLTYSNAAGAPGKTSADADVSDVRIAQIVPGERVVQHIDFDSEDPTFHGTMHMEWLLHAVTEGTWVEIIARNVPEGISARDHAAGLTSSLSNLAAYLEP